MDNTSYPKQQNTDIRAEISYDSGIVAVCSIPCQIISDVLESAGYSHNDTFTKYSYMCSSTSGMPADRMAEIGSKLLQAGVPITIKDSDILQKAIKGDYEPIYPKWVLANKDTVRIVWTGKNEELYKMAKALPTARLKSNSIFVDVSQYVAIREFAKNMKFKISERAEKILSNAEKR